jgi:hypothetical protein
MQISDDVILQIAVTSGIVWGFGALFGFGWGYRNLGPLIATIF